MTTVRTTDPGDITTHDAEKAVVALRTPDASLSRVPNVVRQSMADVIQRQIDEIAALRRALGKCGPLVWAHAPKSLYAEWEGAMRLKLED